MNAAGADGLLPEGGFVAGVFTPLVVGRVLLDPVRATPYQIISPTMMTVMATRPPVQKDSFLGSGAVVFSPTGFVSMEAT